MPSSKLDDKYELSVIIPTLNRLPALKSCLESVWRNTSASSYEIIVHANECTEETKQFLAGWSSVKTIESSQNLFFTSAVNRAIETARGKYILLLNDDCTIVRKDWFETYVKLLTEDDKIGAVGPLWKNIDELPYGWIEPYASFYRRSIFEELGPLPYFNDDFVLWWSDIYHSYLLMNKGYYIRPLSRSFSDRYFLHERVGESGQTVLKMKSVLPDGCFKYHGKEIMYKRLTIESEQDLVGYYRSQVVGL